MSATTPSSSLLPLVEFDRTGSSPFLATQFEDTKAQTRDITYSVPHSTSTSVGTSILQKLRPDTDKTPKCDSAKYEQYITQDFKSHRVFVDMDVFMKYVLHVLANWKELWGRTIRRIKCNSVFSTAHWDYTRQCGTQGVKEQRFYKPLVDMGNAILDFSKSSPDDCVKPQTPQRYLRNDPKRVLSGIMNNLSPDLVAVHDGFHPHICSEGRYKHRLKEIGRASCRERV